jgi:hypothetical protein
MTKSRAILIMLLSAILLTVGVIYAETVYVPVKNPYFQAGITEWDAVADGCTVEWTADGISIPGAALITCTLGSGGLSQAVAISTSGTYTFSVMTVGTADGVVVLEDGESQSFNVCSSSEVDVCSTSLDVPEGVSGVTIIFGMEGVEGSRRFDDATLTYDIPEPVYTMIALDYMMVHLIYTSIGFFAFFVLLPFGLWIGKMKIVGGIKQRDDD